MKLNTIAPTEMVVQHSVKASVHPMAVHETIGKHMLVDALDFVVDLDRSQGSYIYDAKTNRKFLDFFSFVASMPIGMNHPKMNDPRFKERLLAAALNKLTNSDALS